MLQIPFHLDKRLVRGLDYYTKTAFEVLSGELGAQNAVCGGGRYDNLSEAIGGPHLPGVGFAAGIERIVLIMEQQKCDFGPKPRVDVYVIAADDQSREEAFAVATELRSSGIRADLDFLQRSMKAQFKSAVSKESMFTCIIGEEEVSRSVVKVKDLCTGEQSEIPRKELAEYFQPKI